MEDRKPDQPQEKEQEVRKEEADFNATLELLKIIGHDKGATQ